MGMKYRTMDGNEAAAHIAYAFSDVSTIYPITPSSPMAEHMDAWAAAGKKNLFGQVVTVRELESEIGAAGALHGALEAGALATAFSSSQGLMLMIPPMYRMAGQLLPAVIHVAARTIGTHSLSIFGDHSDVMMARTTGFAELASANAQECMDFAAIAHLSAIRGRIPFIHFFDGFRTSHEILKIRVLDYDWLAANLDRDALRAFRKRGMNPERPDQRSAVENPDTFFQHREAINRYYDRLPEIVLSYLDALNRDFGTDYRLFNYYGAPDADHVIVAMGSVSGIVREVVDDLNAKGEKLGFIQARLYRPFSTDRFIAELPAACRHVTVLDRTKEPGAAGEPLYLDVCAALAEHEPRRQVEIFSGRYGLSSKNVTPDMIYSCFDNARAANPKKFFTVGITDDVTFLSLSPSDYRLPSDGTLQCKFWGVGSDGTVGANKNAIKIIGEHTDLYVQAYFEYDAKKSGGITKSHLRFGKNPIRSHYTILENADFVACHEPSYIKKFDLVQELKPGGTLLLNCPWDDAELSRELPKVVREYIRENGIRLYAIDASKIAAELELGNRTNTILQSAFFYLTGVIDYSVAKEFMKDAARKSYGKKGEAVVQRNLQAVDMGAEALRLAVLSDEADSIADAKPEIEAPEYVRQILIPSNQQKGDRIPVSAFESVVNGTIPLGTSKYEKRGIATHIPEWDAEKCIQCNQCSAVCPHAAIRPFLLTEEEAESVPETIRLAQAKGKGLAAYRYRMQVSALDCQGCGVCINTCPAKEKALRFKPLAESQAEPAHWEAMMKLSAKENPFDRHTIKGSQFEQPLLEFSGACAGCGETAYVKLLTQLFGERMIIANATGCTQAWGAAMPVSPYTVNNAGFGPAWSNSVFENNAEFSYGMLLAIRDQRRKIAAWIETLLSCAEVGDEIKAVLTDWIENQAEGNGTMARRDRVVSALSALTFGDDPIEKARLEILDNQEYLSKKSMWMVGGDGWAYDIGFGGLDHVLSQNEDINCIVLDTELYSNTGGQMSKASQLGAVGQFSAGGKVTPKKDLGLIAMTYGYIYVAQISLGADMNHAIRVLAEAEAYKGPSLIIAYAPCINHGIKTGMGNSLKEAKLAAESGYWNLYRFNPELASKGENPFRLDSKEPAKVLEDFMDQEVRYQSLKLRDAAKASELYERASIAAKEKYRYLKELAER